MQRIPFITTLLGLAFSASVAHAQGYPSAPVTLVVPFAAGSGTDSVARAVGQKLSDRLKQPVVIDNKPGASAQIGAQFVAKAKPDGYTLFMTTNTSHSANPSLYSNLKYDPIKDFTPLTVAVSYVNMLVINANHPAKNVKELVEYAKANPGKVSFGSAGNGSSNHLSGEVLKMMTGAPMQHVPYRGSALAMNDTISGQLTFMFDILNVAIPQSRSGRVRALAVTSSKRSPYLPDVPTMEEAGVPGYSAAGSDLWFGIMAPAGLPKPVADKLQGELVKVLRSPEMRQVIRAQFFEPYTSTSEEFTKLIRADGAKWAKIVKGSGARVD